MHRTGPVRPNDAARAGTVGGSRPSRRPEPGADFHDDAAGRGAASPPPGAARRSTPRWRASRGPRRACRWRGGGTRPTRPGTRPRTSTATGPPRRRRPGRGAPRDGDRPVGGSTAVRPGPARGAARAAAGARAHPPRRSTPRRPRPGRRRRRSGLGRSTRASRRGRSRRARVGHLKVPQGHVRTCRPSKSRRRTRRACGGAGWDEEGRRVGSSGLLDELRVRTPRRG